MKKITILMPFLNEEDEPIKTIKSIYETAPSELFQIIAIDDGSAEDISFSEYEDVKLIRNQQRIGVDGCRQLGADLTSTQCILMIDAHMRFKKDNWINKMIECVEKEPQTIWCTTCLGLGYGEVMDVNNPRVRYYGADLMFIDGEDSGNKPCREVLEPKWLTEKKEPGIEYEIPCVLGANYFFSKRWFDYIRGLKGLRMWGSSEPFLSLKTLMAGGKCKIRTDIEIGHKFRSNAPYATSISYLIYNKIFLCKTILPEELGNKILNVLPRDRNFMFAVKRIIENMRMITEDKNYYQSIFKYSINDCCKKFNIKLP